jgi:hypothetical protein
MLRKPPHDAHYWSRPSSQIDQCRLRSLLVMELFDSMLDDETLVRRPQPPVAAVVSDHLELRAAYGRLVATLVVPDTQLAGVSRQLPAGLSVPVSVITSGGAGGLLALARRDLPGVEIASAEPALQDLDDLAGNAARVVSAAAELGPEVAVFVDLPYAPGWTAAVELIEAASLYAKIDAGKADPRQRVEQLSTLIEADLPFKITMRFEAGWLGLLTAVDALVDGASIDDAAQLLQLRHHDRTAMIVAAWDPTTQARVRHRVRRLGADRVQDVINDLRTHEVLASC